MYLVTRLFVYRVMVEYGVISKNLSITYKEIGTLKDIISRKIGILFLGERFYIL